MPVAFGCNADDASVTKDSTCLITISPRMMPRKQRGQADAPAVLSPFQVVGTFRVAFWLSVDDDKIRLDAPIADRTTGQYRMPLLFLTLLVTFTSLDWV